MNIIAISSKDYKKFFKKIRRNSIIREELRYKVSKVYYK